MNNVNLVVLAAGMASRYGGVKQLESVGVNGQTLLDYSVYDAVLSGCGKVIFIIRKAIEKDFREKVFDNIAKRCDASYVFQEVSSLVPSNLVSYTSTREKPYGTVQAILCAKDAVDDNFIVINADDFYGRSSYEILKKHFDASEENALVGYTLSETLSDVGTVNRGICRFDSNSKLVKIEETYKIALEKGKIIGFDKANNPIELSGDCIASMNFFGFNKSVLSSLEDYWAEFVPSIRTGEGKECLLPVFCNEKLSQNTINFKCYTAKDKWFGMTYKEDRDLVRSIIADYTKRGIYPATF